jgi:hypothetical protein
MSLTAAGRRALQQRRATGTDAMARALATGFTTAELEQLRAAAPLFERLAQGT